MLKNRKKPVHPRTQGTTAMTDITESIARAIAGHFGQEYESLPQDRVEMRDWNRSRLYDHWDNSQSDMLDAAESVLQALTDIPIDKLISGEYVAVPVEPGDAVLKAGHIAIYEYFHEDVDPRSQGSTLDCWQVMLKAHKEQSP